MTILSLDSATEVCSAALLQDGEVLAERLNREGSNHAALLPLYVSELREAARLKGLVIDAVAVSEGPGSYTGLRIAASLAKGLCYGLDIPLLSVSTLRVLASAARRQMEPAADVLFCPMIDARRMEVYCALYDAALQQAGETEAKVITAESFSAERLTHRLCLCGNGADKCRTVLGDHHILYIAGILPTAAETARVAYEALVHGQTDTITMVEGKAIAYYEPNYLKDFVAAPSHVKGLT